MERKRVEIICVAVAAVAAFLVVNHFMELAETALVPTLAKRIAFARAQLASSFNPASPLFFVVGRTETALTSGGLAAAGVGICYLMHVFKGNFRKGEEHGSARFATKGEIREYADEEVPTNNVYLARDFRLQAHGSPNFEHSRNRNVLVIGGSGAGKTFGYIKPNLMQIPARENAREGGHAGLEEMEREARSFFVTDSKGTTSVDTGFLFAEHDYPIKMFNVIDWGQSLHFNPFRYITNLVDCMSFATCLVANTTGSNDPMREEFWEKAEKLFFNVDGTLMLTELPPEERNLVSFCKIVDMAMVDEEGQMSALDILMYEIEHGVRYRRDKKQGQLEGASVWGFAPDGGVWEKVGPAQPNHPAVLAYKDFLSGAKETKQSILISVKTRLTPLRASKVLEMLAYDEMELDKIGERKTAVYCVFDGQDETYNFLIAIMIWLLLKQLSTKCATKYAYTNHGELPVGVDFLLDEAANFYIPDLEKTISQCRSQNIGITLLLQSKAQLKNRYRESAETIIDCCDSLVFLGGKSTETLKMLEEMIGPQTVTTENRSANTEQKGVNKALALHGRSLMQAPEIAKMSKLDCLVLVAGANPWKGRKTNPKEMPLWPYVDPGHEGARFKHGFDFAAYRQNRRYYDFETRLETLVEVERRTEYPYARPERTAVEIVRYRIDIVNAGDAPAYGVDFSAEVGITCETNERAVISGMGAPFPRFEATEGNAGWRFAEAFTSRLSPVEKGSADVLEIMETFDRFQFKGVTIEAGAKVTVSIGYEIGRDELMLGFGDAGKRRESGQCEFRFAFEPAIRCANAECDIEGRVDGVSYEADGMKAELNRLASSVSSR